MIAHTTTASERVGRALADALAAEDDCPVGDRDLERIGRGELTVGEWFTLAEWLGTSPNDYL